MRESKSAEFARTKMNEFAELLWSLGSGRYPKRFIVALVEQMERAYAQANFDPDIEAIGEWTLNDAEVLDGLRRYLCQSWDLPELSHDELEEKFTGQAAR